MPGTTRGAPEILHVRGRMSFWTLRVYGWFTEGFDTADLQEAKALLEVLA